MAVPDVVIPVRPGDDNEELRYTLRGIAAHVPHRNVWIIGHKPAWVAPEVRHIVTIQGGGSKYANARNNYAMACATPAISDPFLVFNDDIFVMRPIDEVPTYHRGPVDDVIRLYERRGVQSSYLNGMRETARWLLDAHGIDEPLSYEVHVPYLMDKDRRMHVVAEVERAGLALPHMRTIYGNLFRLGGEAIEDPKIVDETSTPPADAVFVSTSDTSFARGAVGRWIRARLSEPGPYELPDEEVAA